MTPDERRQLKAVVAHKSDEWVINIAFGAALLVLPTLAVTSMLGQKQLQQVLVPAAAAVGAAAGLYFQLKLRRLLASEHAATRADIRNGDVEEVEAVVREAACIPEFEDEGLAVFLAISPDATLFLQGQYLYDIGETAEGLLSSVRVARAPVSRTVLAFSTWGDPIPSLTLLPRGIYRQLPEDGDLLPLAIQEAVVRHAKVAAGRRDSRRTRG